MKNSILASVCAVFRAPGSQALHVAGSGAKTRVDLQVGSCWRMLAALGVPKIKLNKAKI